MRTSESSTLLEIDIDIPEEVVCRLLAGKEVVDGKHAGYNVELFAQVHLPLAQVLSGSEFRSQLDVCTSMFPKTALHVTVIRCFCSKGTSLFPVLCP